MIARWLALLSLFIAMRTGNVQAQQTSVLPVMFAKSAPRDPYAILSTSQAQNWILGATPELSFNAPPIQDAALLRNRKLLPLRGGLFPQKTSPHRGWLSMDWLLWQTDGMDAPPLVTASPPGTPQTQAGILGEPGTQILFGNQELNGGSANGFRVTTGFWVTPQQTFAIEGEYFRLAEQDDGYFGSSNGSAILARPFFDILAGRETAQLVSYPGLVAGDLGIQSESNLQSAIVNLRAALCPTHGNCNCRHDRIDWIVGYRYLQLDDKLIINENLRSLLSTAPGTIDLQDDFRTKNRFNGLQLGLVHRATFQRGFLESMLRVAIGNNDQSVRINGNTVITEAGFSDPFTGGLLAQRTNIGHYQRDEFMMVPEIGLKLGVRLTQRLSATIGYSALYFPNVVRAANQIDTDVNPNLVAPEVDPFAGALRPQFRFIESDYWAQGFTLGGELNF